MMMGEAAAGNVEQEIIYAHHTTPETMRRTGVHSVHPLEFVGVGIVKPVLSKPRTVDPLAYGWGNLEKYHREKDEQDTIKLSTLAVKERLENMETRICNAHSPLNPDNFGKLAHRTWTEFGKEMHDSLTYEEFQDCLRFLDIHMTDPKAKPLFRVGDLDNSGLMSFDEFKFVLSMVSQLPRPRMVSLWEVFLIFSKQNYGFINDFEFWKILTVSTNISCEIEKGEAKFLAFRNYHRANFPEFILNYERFCELWVKTVCEMGYCRTELIRRGVSKSQLKKHKVNARGPAAYLRHVVGQIDAWDQLSFERAKKWAFEHRKRIRVTRSIKLADRTKLRVDDDANKRKEVAVVLKEKQVEDMIKERRRVQREKVETKLMRQMKEEAQNREERERQVLTELLRKKREWEEEQRIKKGKDTIDMRHQSLWRVPLEIYEGDDAQSDLADVILLDLAHNKISELPGQEFIFWCSSMQKIDVSHNILTHVPVEIGNIRNHLVLLDLHHNRIMSLPDELGLLDKLEVLDLSQNNIPVLPDTFGNLKKLRRLDASQNRLEMLPLTFGQCTNLEYLYLQQNDLRDLPENVDQLTALKRVDLSQNVLRRLPKYWGNLKALEILKLQTNQLDRLPRSFGECTKLQVLFLQRNNLRTVPDNFSQMTLLKELNISRNGLLGLPQDIGNLRQLQILNIEGNDILELPVSFGTCVFMRSLRAAGNKIKAILHEIGALQLLEYMDMGDNHIAGPLPIGIGTLFSIQQLKLPNNRITSVPANLGQLNKLEVLDLSNNRIAELPESLGDLKNLRELRLSCNVLRSLPYNTRDLRRLVEFDVGGNLIEYLPRELGKMTALRKLGCANNQLKALPAELGHIIDNLEFFDATRNPLSDFPQKWCSSWTLTDQHSTLWSGYTNDEVRMWLKIQKVVYQLCVGIWETRKSEWQSAKSRVIQFLRLVREAAGRAWKDDFVPVVRAFFVHAKRKGVVPQYHQPFPGEHEELHQQVVAWNAHKKKELSFTRQLQQEMYVKQDRTYAYSSDDLARIANRGEMFKETKRLALEAYTEAQILEAIAREDRQEDVMDELIGQREANRAAILTVAQRRLTHYNHTDLIRKQKERIKKHRAEIESKEARVYALDIQEKTNAKGLSKVKEIIAKDEFLFEPQRVKAKLYGRRDNFLKKIKEARKEREDCLSRASQLRTICADLEKQHDAYFDEIRDNPPPGARLLTRYSV